MVAPATGRYLLVVRAQVFGESRQLVTVGDSSPERLNVVLHTGGFQEEVTVSAVREQVDSLRLTAQPVNIVTAEEVAKRVNTVVAQAVQAEAGVQLQHTSPPWPASSSAGSPATR